LQSNETTLSQPLLDFIQARVIETCDLNDGVRDNLIENPLDCEFDIHSLACGSDGSAENSTCLTPMQISAVEAVYQGPVRSDDPGVSLYPGISLGSEAGWALPIVSAALSNAFTVSILQNLVFDDLQYDANTFNWASDVDIMNDRAGPLINAINTDLSSFRSGGSKMIAYAGWADPNIAPEWSLEHVEDVTKDTIGQETAIEDNDFLKLVMIPGGGHCGANIARYPYVPASYGFSSAIIDWVEKDTEPLEGIKSWSPPNGDDRTRRLCTWPRVAKLSEGGDQDDWESYTCG
jgi:feruloyl esterase